MILRWFRFGGLQPQSPQEIICQILKQVGASGLITWNLIKIVPQKSNYVAEGFNITLFMCVFVLFCFGVLCHFSNIESQPSHHHHVYQIFPSSKNICAKIDLRNFIVLSFVVFCENISCQKKFCVIRADRPQRHQWRSACVTGKNMPKTAIPL